MEFGAPTTRTLPYNSRLISEVSVNWGFGGVSWVVFFLIESFGSVNCVVKLDFFI